MQYMIDQETTGLRIDKALALLNSELTRSYITLCIDQGLVQVNGTVVKKSSYKVKENDCIEMELLPINESEIKPQAIDLDILYEDNDILVLNKPKNMVVHPSAGHSENTLVNALLAHCSDLSGINGIQRPGIVHRLDKDTTGVMVVCKNDQAHHQIAQQFKDHTLDKYYIALVDGIINEQSGRINAPIGRDSNNRQKMGVNENGKEAITEFKVLHRFNHHTLVQCHLLTGRTHQIRVHMAFINHPVTNDSVYGKKIDTSYVAQFLHSSILELEHPTTHERMHFEAALPSDFQECMNSIENL